MATHKYLPFNPATLPNKCHVNVKRTAKPCFTSFFFSYDISGQEGVSSFCFCFSLLLLSEWNLSRIIGALFLTSFKTHGSVQIVGWVARKEISPPIRELKPENISKALSLLHIENTWCKTWHLLRIHYQ